MIAVGEPAEATGGWRLTHGQAKATLALGAGRAERVLRYRDVALLSGLLGNDLLATSLRRMYLEPLEATKDGGQSAYDTLRAYFAAQGNTSSAAAALGVKRHTVTNRLRAIEEKLGRPLTDCYTELQAALELAEFDLESHARPARR